MQRRKRGGGLRASAFHQMNRRSYATGPVGVTSVWGRSEEDLVCDLEMEMKPHDATAGGEDLNDVRQL